MHCTCATLSSVACPALQYFSTLSHKRYDFRGEKKLLNTKCVLIFCTTFVWNISHYEKEWARYDHRRLLVLMWSTGYSCQILMKFNHFDRFSKNTEISNIPPVGAELFHADTQTDRQTDGRTDMTKLAILRTRFKTAEIVWRHCVTPCHSHIHMYLMTTARTAAELHVPFHV
jgi:predicted membrane protein